MDTMDLPVLPPVEPMLAKAQAKVPDEVGVWSYEPKWDGFRALVFRDGDEVVLQSRNGKELGRYFPELVDALRDEFRMLDHIGRVQPAAEAGFEQQKVGGTRREDRKRGGSRDLEKRDRVVSVHALAFGECPSERRIVDQNAAARVTQANALVKADEARRRIGVYTEPRRFENRAQDRDGRAFAVGARDMNRRRQFALGMAETREQAMNTAEPKVDLFRMQPREPLEQRVGGQISARGASAHTAPASAGSCRSMPGDLVSRRQMRASVGRR